MGQFGSGLDLTRIRLDQIRWNNHQPTADREDDRIGLVEASPDVRGLSQGQRFGKWQESSEKKLKNGRNLAKQR